jgi:hypothetical protein
VAGFVRRYGFSPGSETITLVEGVIIVDLPPPGSIKGVQTGVVGMPGEFADMTYATSVDTSGVVTTYARPVEVFSGQDLLDKLGGYDSTLGNTGKAGGSGFIELRNKKFSRLVCVPVNIAAAAGGRVYRDLPTNLSATQAIPVVPIQGGKVSAGREFKASANRVHIAKTIGFTAKGHYKNGVDGAVTAFGSAQPTQTFNSATGAFLTANSGSAVKKGDLLVVGVIGAAGAQGANAFTFRVTADAASNTALVVEKMSGVSFDWTTGTALAYRVHPASDADSAGVLGDSAKLSDAIGYRVPCRPLDASVASATACTPVLVPASGTATSWDVLSGLTLVSHVSSGFVYDSTIHAPNAVNHANLDALYATAFDAMLASDAPSRDVNIVFSARVSDTIRAKVKSHCLTASGNGVGRVGCTSPDLQTVSLATAIGDAAPGVGATRDESVFYVWPGWQTFVPEAVGFSQGTADASTTTDGILDTKSDGWLAAVLSNLAPERNPGQAAPPVPEILAPCLAIQRGAPALGLGEYISLRQNGVCAPRNDRTVGMIFQSGITSSLISGQKNINRRRFAYFIQDSISQSLVPSSKLPLTDDLKDTMLGQVDSFLLGLKSPNNKAAQRIDDYSVDGVSGNTPSTLAQGIYVIIAKVRMTPTADFIVLQTEVSENTVITKVNQ